MKFKVPLEKGLAAALLGAVFATFILCGSGKDVFARASGDTPKLGSKPRLGTRFTKASQGGGRILKAGTTTITISPSALRIGTVVDGVLDDGFVQWVDVDASAGDVTIEIAVAELLQNGGSGVVPASALKVGIGTSADKAFRNAAKASYGETTATFYIRKAGSKRYYISWLANLSIGMPAGDYMGVLTATHL